MYDFSNKTVIVTGGAAGLGAEYVRALHARGANVVAADIDREAGAAIESELGPRCHFVYADASDPESVNPAFRSGYDRFGGLHVLVNNAGAYPHQDFEEIKLEEWRRVIRVNLDSVFVCTQEAVRLMKPARAGKIVNIATNAVWMLVPHMAHYIAAKAGVVGFTRAAAHELGALGITINALSPGANMPRHEMSEPDIRRMRQIVSFQSINRPQHGIDLVGALLFLCSPDSDFMTGQTICVDGGLAAH
jgi:NAD(P)-dependent dehydrogenase (short-subunit alcohol dehydrogenase family)